VAAALAREAGHQVVGVTLRRWGGESDAGCCSVADVDDARRVAQQLGIDHLVFNFTDDFHERVVDPYVAAHARGVTPNPCIECNRHVKFSRLLERARLLEFDLVATGHHAQVAPWPGVGAPGRLGLARGADRAKDQSYVVHMLTPAELARTWLPVGALTKDRVRAIAAELGLRTAAKPDSQDVCFVPAAGDGRRSFLGRRIPLHPAEVVDTAGRRVGEVPAVELVTVGQRRGLGLPGGGEPRYVVDVDVAAARVVVGPAAELVRPQLEVTATTWTDGPVHGEVLVQVSAHGRAHPAVVEPDGDDGLVVRWHEPQRRVAPGQSVVLYDPTDTWVLGGGLAR
jgi:tRNA-specific 2-thiouridylase